MNLNLEESRQLMNADNLNRVPQQSAKEEAADVLSSFWRYRWAVLLPTLAGAIIGFMVYLQLPETHRSTTRLMIESDQAAVLDQLTGDLFGGVPSLEIVRAQLFSDQVMTMAYSSPKMRPFHAEFNDSPLIFIGMSSEMMKLEFEVEDVKTAKSVVALLHYDSANAELSVNAVHAFSESLQKFYSKEKEDSRGELIKMISDATENMLPKLEELESRHREFRRDAPLAWDQDGNAYNPHREKQLFLIGKRSELLEEFRRKSAELVSVESIVKKSSKDPLLALNIIGQLLNRKFELPRQSSDGVDTMQGDNPLAQIEVDKQLIPLMIEAKKYEVEYGPNHPTVKSVKSDLAIMKNELRRLVEKETSRIVELMEKTSGRTEDDRSDCSSSRSSQRGGLRLKITG